MTRLRLGTSRNRVSGERERQIGARGMTRSIIIVALCVAASSGGLPSRLGLSRIIRGGQAEEESSVTVRTHALTRISRGGLKKH